MSEVGRNALCPCGSGRKYKNCCLRRHEDAETRERRHRSGFGLAVGWLMDHHLVAAGEAIERGFFHGLEADERESLNRLPAHLLELIRLDQEEWLLAEGAIEAPTAEAARALPVLELVLGPGGPELAAEQRAYLTELGERPLRLYEVLEVRTGDSLLLRDMLDDSLPPFRVQERILSVEFETRDVLGARLLQVDGEWNLSAAFYRFSAETGTSLVGDLADQLEEPDLRAAGAVPGSEQPESISQVIRFMWLTQLVEPLESAENPLDFPLVRAGTGEPLIFVTDEYKVSDWDRLSRALGTQPDVEGDRSEGWARLEPGGGDMRRALLDLMPGTRHDRLEAFARTRRLAEEGRAWLKQVGGGSLRFLRREMVDSKRLLERESDPLSSPP